MGNAFLVASCEAYGIIVLRSISAAVFVLVVVVVAAGAGAKVAEGLPDNKEGKTCCCCF